MSTARFEGQGAEQYDARIQQLIPGYSLMQELTASSLLTLFPGEANILVVGAGTGSEISTLAGANALWQFAAVDISSEMLDVAQHRFVSSGIASRVSIHHGALSQVPLHRDFDVVLCFYVMHFLPHDHDKDLLLQEIRSSLKSDGYLFLADLMAPASQNERASQGMMCSRLGLEEEKIPGMLQRLNSDFYPLSEGALHAMVQRASFQTPVPFFQAFGFHAYQIQAARDVSSGW